MKTILFALSTILCINTAAFADCLNYAGEYELVPATAQSNSCDDNSIGGCFTYPGDAFKIVENGCDDIRILAPGTWSGELALAVQADGSLVGKSNSLGRTMTTTLKLNADGTMDLDYTQVSTFLGNWAKTYEYTASFRKVTQ